MARGTAPASKKAAAVTGLLLLTVTFAPQTTLARYEGRTSEWKNSAQPLGFLSDELALELYRQIGIPLIPVPGALPIQIILSGLFPVNFCFAIPVLPCFCCTIVPVLGLGNLLMSISPTRTVTTTSVSTTTCTSSASQACRQQKSWIVSEAYEPVEPIIIEPTVVLGLETTPPASMTTTDNSVHVSLLESSSRDLETYYHRHFDDTSYHRNTKEYYRHLLGLQQQHYRATMNNYHHERQLTSLVPSLFSSFNSFLSSTLSDIFTSAWNGWSTSLDSVFPPLFQSITSIVRRRIVTKTSTIFSISLVTSKPSCWAPSTFAQCANPSR